MKAWLQDALFGMRCNIEYAVPVVRHYAGLMLANINKRVLMIAYLFDSFVLGLLTLGQCRVGETISSVAWDLEQSGKPLGRVLRPAIDLLMRVFERDHCFGAYRTFLKITGANR